MCARIREIGKQLALEIDPEKIAELLRELDFALSEHNLRSQNKAFAASQQVAAAILPSPDWYHPSGTPWNRSISLGGIRIFKNGFVPIAVELQTIKRKLMHVLSWMHFHAKSSELEKENGRRKKWRNLD
jgi:hypothetical protein